MCLCVSVCVSVFVSAEVTFVCRWLWLVCSVCKRDGATPLWLLWNLAHKLYYCIYAWFYFRLLDNRHVIVRVLNCPAVCAIEKEREKESASFVLTVKLAFVPFTSLTEFAVGVNSSSSLAFNLPFIVPTHVCMCECGCVQHLNGFLAKRLSQRRAQFELQLAALAWLINAVRVT